MSYVFPDVAFRIEGFYPPEREQSFGRWGFSVHLDARFALMCLDAKRPEKEKVTRLADEALTRLFDSSFRPFVALRWWEDTLLLHGVSVPGNACDLSADFQAIRDLRRSVELARGPGANHWTNGLDFTPHNVDGPRQAYGLLALWLRWYECVAATLLT